MPSETKTVVAILNVVLDIPKIGFNKGFYKKESSLNNVKFKAINEDKREAIVLDDVVS